MATRDHGGPAFPHGPGPVDEYMEGDRKIREAAWEAHPGMSLRDWMAGQAVGALAATNIAQCGTLQQAAVAEAAYRIADAMLTARLAKSPE